MSHLVLFVDDEPNLLAALARTLRNESFEIARATSGLEALQVLAARQVDAIVTDCDMPGMRGNELLARAREMQPSCVRMMLTGKPALDVVIDLVDRGEIQRFFVKPCEPAQLAGELRRALREKDLLVEVRRLLIELKRRDALLEDLERRQPGVTHVEFDDEGCVVLDDAPDDIDALIAEMQRATSGKPARARPKSE